MACTPDQIVKLYQPSAALEFRWQAQDIATKDGVLEIAGFVKAAQQEVERRLKVENQREAKRRDWRCHSSSSPAASPWLTRARQAAQIAQELERAATESVETMEAALSDQTWNHNIAYELLDDELMKMEMEPTEILEPNLVRYSSFNGICCFKSDVEWKLHQARRQQQQERIRQRAQQVKQLEEQRERLEAFITKIRTKERADQVMITRQDYKARNGISGTEEMWTAECFSLDQ